jgi:glycerol uptake facilitator-like aquaporin
MIAEIFGAFFLAFLYLTQTEAKYKISKDSAITAIIVSASYVAAVLMAKPPSLGLGCLNPAIGISTTIVMTFGGEGANGIKWIWLYGAMPLVGGVLAILFHEIIYKKVADSI